MFILLPYLLSPFPYSNLTFPEKPASLKIASMFPYVSTDMSLLTYVKCKHLLTSTPSHRETHLPTELLLQTETPTEKFLQR